MEKPYKILILDDEKDMTQILSFQFKADGFEVQTALDGAAGLELLHNGFSPDLIILDINMPRMGGIEFFSKICNDKGQPRYPVMVLTARANIKGLFQDLHIDGFMIKPFEIDQLVMEAVHIVKKKNQEAQAKSGSSSGVPKICIVDHDPKTFDQLCGLCLHENYTVMPAKSGAEAIEKMMRDVPDVAVVSLGLVDIPGDMVIYRLSHMSRTMDVKFVLYTSKTAEHDRQVMERIRIKTGILTFVEYGKLEEVLQAVNQVLAP